MSTCIAFSFVSAYSKSRRYYMSNRRLAIITVCSIVIITLIGLGAFLYWRSNSSQSTAPPTTSPTMPPATTSSNETPQSTPATYPVKVFFSKHPESDDDPTRTFPVNRTSPDSGVATYAISQLIAGPTSDEVKAGYFSQVAVRDDASICNGRDFTLTIESGVATLQFCRTFEAIGTITDAQADQTIQATLKQFPTVTRVVVLSKDGHCQFDLTGEDRCKQ